MTRVALVGANGYGLSHRRNLATIDEAELVALCDTACVEDPEAPVYTDHREMLRDAKPDVVIVATPPFTHLPIALDAVEAGCDVYVEKPPVLSLAEHARLLSALDAAGRVCQVGFQALGSHALARLRQALADGVIGDVTAVCGYGAWQRADWYWNRSPWAGRRTVGGRPSVDGALANPFAHALMQCLAIADESDVDGIEVERYNVREQVEVDETGCVRVRLASGRTVLVAVTLNGEELADPEIVVHGTAGQARLAYTRDRLEIPGFEGTVDGRANLLRNLLTDRGALIAPLHRTARFTQVLEQIAVTPVRAIHPSRVAWSGEGRDRLAVVDSVNSVVRAAARSVSLLSEVDDLAAPSPKTTGAS
jgi:predicted dehydrogenase